MFTIKIRIRGYRRGNQKWKIQRSFQHRVHKTQDEDKLKKSTTQYVLDTTIRKQIQIITFLYNYKDR